MYRSGVYTNAEWLEFRFGPLTRVLAVFINIQSRTNVVGNIFFSLYLVLHIIGELDATWSWAVVVLVAATAVVYVVTGGLESDVITNALQAVAMIVSSLVLWGVVWFSTGGMSGLTRKLAQVDESLPAELLHVGGYTPEGATPILMVFGLVVVLVTYAVINQYEAIRFLGARSEWDFKMGAVLASVITAVCLWFNVSLGPLARAHFPGLEIIDSAYPMLVREYLRRALSAWFWPVSWRPGTRRSPPSAWGSRASSSGTSTPGSWCATPRTTTTRWSARSRSPSSSPWASSTSPFWNREWWPST